LKVILLLLALTLFVGLFLYEPHVEISFYSREWIQSEILPVEPLMGCMNSERVSPLYNVSKYGYGLKNTEVHAGVPMQF
ncbi:hypothetical protein HYDPIDRAFT_72266, partial [Hydnomerulius pinastri MD-312]